MYSEKVMDHFEHPRNVGEIPNASGTGTVGNAKCGDIMKMDIDVQNGVIQDVKFKTFGCCAAIATSSIATEMVKGKTIDEALQLTNKAVAEALGNTGRILVRESGTEPLVRVMVEAPEHETCEKYVAQVVDVIKAKGYAI